MTEIEIAWLAGILEGEGCFDIYENNYNKNYPRLRIEMCDKDVLDRIKSIIDGGGEVIEHDRGNPKHNKTYSYSLSSKNKLKEVLTDILPYMGERRKEKIEELLSVGFLQD